MFQLLLTFPFAVNTAESSPMSWLQFIDSMFGRLAWPLVALMVLLVLRTHLGALAERVLEFSFGGATFKFAELLKKGAEVIDQAPPTPENTEPPGPEAGPEPQSPVGVEPAPNTFSEPTRRLDSSRLLYSWEESNQPWNIISEWNQIEGLLNTIAELFGSPTRNGSAVMSLLLRRELINSKTVELFETLRKARDEAVHGKGAPSEVQVAEFARQAQFLKSELDFATVQLRLIHKDRRMPK